MRKFNHVGYPTAEKIEGMYFKESKVTITDSTRHPYNIEKLHYDDDSTEPSIIKSVPHIAFEVDNIYEEIKNKKILVEPLKTKMEDNRAIILAFIEEENIPVEFIQFLD